MPQASGKPGEHLAPPLPGRHDAPAGERVGYLQRGERIIKVAFVDHARRRLAAGQDGLRLLARDYDMVWHDTGAPLSARDRAAAQTMVDAMRPPLLARIGLVRRADKNGEIHVRGDYYLSQGNLDAVRGVCAPLPPAGAAALNWKTFRARREQDIVRARPGPALERDLIQALDQLQEAETLRRLTSARRAPDPAQTARLHSAGQNLQLLHDLLARLEHTNRARPLQEIAAALIARTAALEMSIADLIGFYAASPRPALYAPADQAEARPLHTQAMIEAVRLLKKSRPGERSLARLCTGLLRALSRHHSALTRTGPVMAAPGPSTPLSVIRSLKTRWAATGPHRFPPLPVPAPLPQETLLALYLRHALARAGYARRTLPDLAFLLRQGQSAALNDDPAPRIEAVLDSAPAPDRRRLRSRLCPAPPRLALSGGQHDLLPHALACSELTDDAGRILYRAHRSAVPAAADLTSEQLARLGRAGLQALFARGRPGPGGDLPNPLPAFAPAPARFDALVESVQLAAAKSMTRSLIAALLLNHPQKRAAAFEGQIVDLPVAALCLIAPGPGSPAQAESAACQAAAALDILANHGAPLALTLCPPEARKREVRIFLRPKFYAFRLRRAASGAWGLGLDPADPALAELAGPHDEPFVGGRARARMNHLQEESRRLIRRLETAPGGAPGSCRTRLRQLMAQNRALHHLGQQVKTLWRDPDAVCRGRDPYKMAVRIAALAYALGDEIAVHCRNGLDRTGPFDDAVKYLHLCMDRHGAPPAPDLDADPVARMRFAHAVGGLQFARRAAGLSPRRLSLARSFADLLALYKTPAPPRRARRPSSTPCDRD